MMDKLTRRECNKIVELLYNSKDMQSNHNTNWTDKYRLDHFRDKMIEIIKCEEHDNCIITNKVLEIGKNVT